MSSLTLSGVAVDVTDQGNGKPMLVLHDELGFAPQLPAMRLLAQSRRVIALSLPGFGTAPLPDWVDTPDDLSYVCLELMDHLRLPKFDLLGCGFGGWVAAELATKVPERLGRLVLCAPFGVKLGATDKLDIPDIFAMSPATLNAKMFHDPSLAELDIAALSDAEAAAIVRCRETLALLGWEPYLHNPKLRRRLHRVGAPSLFLRGASDGLVSLDYLTGYAGLLPSATVAQIAAAGHFPHREQPDQFAAQVMAFLDA